MKTLQKLCTLLIVLSLAACDDKATQPATSAQSFPEFDSFQTTPGIEELKARLVMNPNDFNALSALGDLYFESAQYFEAIQVYNEAIGVNPMCADCYNDKGLASFYMNDVNTAIMSFDKAVSIDPAYTHAWLSKGFVLVSVGRYQEAVEPLNKVKELDTTGGLAAEADKFLAMVAERSRQ